MAGPNVYELVTAKILDALDAGTVPWRTPWTSGGSVPRSLATGRPYRGINPFLLQMEAIAGGYTSPWWGTFDQITERAGLTRAGKRWAGPDGDDRPRGVTKGQRGTLIVFWARTTKEATNPVTGQTEERKLFLLRYFKVFNLDQAAFPDGLPDRYTSAGERPAGFDPVAEAEQLAAGYFGQHNDGPRLVHVDDGRAFYTPVMDVVNVPPQSCFTTAEGYYSTLFHEAGHSTGHPSRLARPGVMDGHRFGDDDYSQEELVAEFTAAYLCGIAGIDPEASIGNSAAYIAGWAAKLQADTKLVVYAAAQAQRAADRVQRLDFSAGGYVDPVEDVEEPAA